MDHALCRFALQASAVLMLCGITGCARPSTRGELPNALLGRWEGVVEEGLYVEEWQAAGDSTFDGTAILYQDGQSAGKEQMRITRFAGQWLFLASTGGTRITCFVLSNEQDGKWIFENREHDYPQRIGYRLHGDTLFAYVALLDDQGDRMDFVLHRVDRKVPSER